MDTKTRVALEKCPGDNVLETCSVAFFRLHVLPEDDENRVMAEIEGKESSVTLALYNGMTVLFRLAVVSPLDHDDGDIALFSPLDVLRDMFSVATSKTFSSVVALWISLQDLPASDISGIVSRIVQVMDCADSVRANGHGATLLDVLRPQKDMPVPLPRLDHLTIEEVDIADDQSASGASVKVNTLYECLEERQSRGHELETLEIDCKALVSDQEKVAGRLRAAVKYLSWWSDM